MSTLTKVTITGADDDTDPEALVRLSKKYPFVEWGILIDGGMQRPRFPSLIWQARLLDLKFDSEMPVNLSAHACGRLVFQMLGDGKWRAQAPVVWGAERLQVNTHGVVHSVDDNSLIRSLKALRRAGIAQTIFQWDDKNPHAPWLANVTGFDTAVLFDLSHGAGVLPDQWPVYKPTFSCGYAGGLGPDNVAEHLKKIQAVAGDFRFWIDMETRVRDDHDRLDLGKVDRVLEICASHVIA